MNVPSPRLAAGDIANVPGLSIITLTEDYELLDFLQQQELGFGDDDWLRACDGLVTIVGRGATGKTKLVTAVTEIYPDHFVYVPVHTTRRLRETEQQGIDIVCLNDAEFDQRRGNNEYIVSYWVGHNERRKRSALPLEPVKQVLRAGKRVVAVVPAPVSDLLAYIFGHIYRICLNPSPEDHRQYQQFRGLSPEDSNGQNYAGFIYERDYLMPGVIQLSNHKWRLYQEIKRRRSRREDGHARTLYEMVVKPPRFYQRLALEHPELATRLNTSIVW